jgi:hypothetical protein
VCFSHHRKIVILLNHLQISIADLLNSRTSDCNRHILRKPSYNLIFLDLVVNNWNFDLLCAQKLSSEQRVSSSNYDGLTVESRHQDRNYLADYHHCCVTHFRVPFLLYLAGFAH